MAHKYININLSSFQNNQEWSLPGHQKYGYFIDMRSGVDLPSNDFTSTYSHFPAKKSFVVF